MASTSPSTCSVENFPFNFFAPNGTTIPGELDDNGFCIFPNANCSPDAPITSCCNAQDAVDNTGDNYMFIAFAVIFLPAMYLRYGAGSNPASDEARKARNERMTPTWVKNFGSERLVRLFGLGLIVYILFQILVPIFMRNSIQSQLSVTNRNTVIAAEAFLVPYNQIFQFIEDIVLVRVNYALARQNKALTNELVHIGLMGSFFSGVLAAVIGTILGVIPQALAGLTNPGAKADASLYPNCDLIVDATDQALPYWLVEVWAIPGTQMGLVLTGFMMGAMQLSVVGWIGSISMAMILIVWFSAVNQASNPILVLAFAEFTAAWVLPILSILYLIGPLGSDLREHTGVKLQFHKLVRYWHDLRSSKNGNDLDEKRKEYDEVHQEVVTKNGAGDDPVQDQISTEIKNGDKDVTVALADDQPMGEGEHGLATKDEEAIATVVAAAPTKPLPSPQSTKDLLKEGLKIMFMDVAIQCCISLSIYLALSKNAAEGYQLTALQSALPSYGIAYALGMGVMMKIVGPQLLAAEKFQLFANFARVTVLCAFLLVPLILGSVIPFRSGMAFNYGLNACEYAKNSDCVAFFNNVFGPNAQGGTYSLPFTFDVFPLGAGIEAVFFVLRATLLTLVDLEYMMICTIVALVLYIPVIVVASVVEPFGGRAISFFVAMYIPQVVLCVCFLIRLHVLLRRMLSGGKGTWSEPRSGSMRSIVMQSGSQ